MANKLTKDESIKVSIECKQRIVSIANKTGWNYKTVLEYSTKLLEKKLDEVGFMETVREVFK